MAAAVRWFGVGGRGLLFLAAFTPLFVDAAAAVAVRDHRQAAAALSKILENMELGHNVMHGHRLEPATPSSTANL